MVQIIGLSGESMNPMTFGNMTHPRHCSIAADVLTPHVLINYQATIWSNFLSRTKVYRPPEFGWKIVNVVSGEVSFFIGVTLRKSLLF